MMGHLGETVDELEGAEEGAQAAGEDERRGERGFDGPCLLCIRGGRGRRKNWDGMELRARERGWERGRATLGRESSVPPCLPRSAAGQNTFVYVIN